MSSKSGSAKGIVMGNRQENHLLYVCECNGRPELRILPKTETALTVEQFQRLFWNCFWHSRMATTAPDLTAFISSTLRRQICFCLRTSPTSRSHSFSARMWPSAPVDAIDLYRQLYTATMTITYWRANISRVAEKRHKHLTKLRQVGTQVKVVTSDKGLANMMASDRILSEGRQCVSNTQINDGPPSLTSHRHGLVSARRPAATTLFHGRERNLATEPSLWPAHMEQSTSSSLWSWQLAFVYAQAQNTIVYFMF